MLLYIVRHAFAGQHGDPSYPDDSQRPLTEEGCKQFRRLIKKIREHGFAPQQIITSPYVRCRQTAEIIADVVDIDPPVNLDALTPGSDLPTALRWTRRHQVAQIAWVGHSPDVEQMTAALIGDRTAAIHFGKGSIAAIKFEDSPAIGAGELRWLVTTKLCGQ